MSDVFRLLGSISCSPATAATDTSGDLGEDGLLMENFPVGAKLNLRPTLSSDSPFGPPLLLASGGPFVVGANVLLVRAVGGKVRVRVTTSDGATQAFPVDDVCLLISLSVPITAIDLTRVTGVSTLVKLFMAEAA